MMFGIILTLFIAWKIYEHSYYKGESFNKLKKSLNNYIVSCNELNEHIEELKETYSGVIKYLDLFYSNSVTLFPSTT